MSHHDAEQPCLESRILQRVVVLPACRRCPAVSPRPGGQVLRQLELEAQARAAELGPRLERRPRPAGRRPPTWEPSRVPAYMPAELAASNARGIWCRRWPNGHDLKYPGTGTLALECGIGNRAWGPKFHPHTGVRVPAPGSILSIKNNPKRPGTRPRRLVLENWPCSHGTVHVLILDLPVPLRFPLAGSCCKSTAPSATEGPDFGQPCPWASVARSAGLKPERQHTSTTPHDGVCDARLASKAGIRRPGWRV